MVVLCEGVRRAHDFFRIERKIDLYILPMVSGGHCRGSSRTRIEGSSCQLCMSQALSYGECIVPASVLAKSD